MGKEENTMFAIGKIPPEILERIVMQPLTESRTKRADVILRPTTGEDCCAIDTAGEYCLLSTDPITGASKDIGYLAVQINCNDIYSSGAEPIGVLLTVLLPPHSGEDTLAEIMQGALRAAEERGIEILGGHTEVTAAVCQPILSAAVVGKTRGRRILATGAAKAGEDIVMTKWAGTEGTAILAQEWGEQAAAWLSPQELENAKALKDCLSVGAEAEIAARHGASAMHDATEGGVLGAVWEVAACSGLGVDVFAEAIPVRAETKKLCDALGIDYLRLISSGTMIVATENGQELTEKLRAAGISAAVIGRLTEGGRYLLAGGMRLPLAEPKSDALYDALPPKQKTREERQ